MYDWDDVKAILIFLSIVGLCLLLLMASILGCATINGYMSCQEMIALHPTYNIHWGFWTGCRVQMPSGIWLSVYDLKYIEGEFRITDDR